MTHIKIDLQGTTNEKPTEVSCVVPEDNPYDDGYLLTAQQASLLLDSWVKLDREPDIMRSYKETDEGTFVTVLLMEGELILSEWPSTTDHHNFETGNQSVDLGEPGYSTEHWPFDFVVEEAMESSAVINKTLLLVKALESELQIANPAITGLHQQILREKVAGIRTSLEVPYND